MTDIYRSKDRYTVVRVELDAGGELNQLLNMRTGMVDAAVSDDDLATYWELDDPTS